MSNDECFMPVSIDDVKSMEICSSGSTELNCDSEISPEKYLAYAFDDLDESASERSSINAVSNAKRALHLQIQILTEALGGNAFGLNQRSNFPKLLKFCEECGISTPRIIKKLNAKRNKVEHEYYSPSREESEDFVDIVGLFFSATIRLLHCFPTSMEFSKGKLVDGRSESYLNIHFTPGSDTLEMRGRILEISGDEYEKLVIKEYETVKGGKINGTDPDLRKGNFLDLPMIKITKRIYLEHSRDFEFKVTHSNRDEYTSWMSLFIQSSVKM